MINKITLVWLLYITLKTVEQKREVRFSEFTSEFLLILFFPFGIWIIQPRINKIASQFIKPDEISDSTE